MATGKALNGKPYAGNPHVRFDEGKVAPASPLVAGTPLRGAKFDYGDDGKSIWLNATSSTVRLIR